VRVARERCAELNRGLVQAGFAVSAFAPQRARLEDFFHAAIGRDAPSPVSPPC
jgi:hypothetical protein